LCYGNTNLVFENGHRDFVLSEHKFVLDYLKNTLINTNLCGIFEFSTQNAKIPHKFVSNNVFFKLFNTKVCVLATQNPCDRFRIQTFLECINSSMLLWSNCMKVWNFSHITSGTASWLQIKRNLKFKLFSNKYSEKCYFILIKRSFDLS
jgi:hypothetical protein